MSVGGTLLITSGAYAGPDFVSTFGLLPPAFLPVGNQRLYEHQAAVTAGLKCRKILSIPQDFEIEPHEKERLNALEFELIPVPTGLSLGASVGYVMDTAGIISGEFRILHGDTLISGLPLADTDIVSEGTSSEYYAWAECKATDNGAVEFVDGLMAGQSSTHGGERQVLSGYFCFQDAELYRMALNDADEAFVPSLNAYARKNPLQTKTAGDWLDFGHLDRYYKSRAQITTERSFNAIDISPRTVRKSSEDNFKMDAEVNWFESISPSIKTYAPQFLGASNGEATNGYETEYLYLSPLSDLHVFGRLPTFVWQRIYQSCDEFLTACREHRPDGSIPGCDSLYLDKTLERLETYAKQTGTSLKNGWTFDELALPSLQEIAEQCAREIPSVSEQHVQVMHGDFCFSNIFYDFRSNAIRVVDPRGYVDAGKLSIFGDIRYDIAKLYHSVIGEYDTIVSGVYALQDDGGTSLALTLPDTPNLRERQKVFKARKFAGLSISEAATEPIAVLLFLSMLPLHEDRLDRQRAFLANALRLFQQLDT